MEIIIYPEDQNAFSNKNIHTWAVNNGLDYVVEIHRNAGGGRGVESLIMPGLSPDAKDGAVYNTVVSYGFTPRGYKNHTEFLNMSLMNTVGISYSLIEVGFIDTPADNELYDATYQAIGNDLYTNLQTVGVTRLGVVYGHGAGDPGACAFGRNEAFDVRKLRITPVVTPAVPEVPEVAVPVTPEIVSYQVGDTVIPTVLVDYDGTPLVQYDDVYTITELIGDRAVLEARGQVWAAMNVANIQKV